MTIRLAANLTAFVNRAFQDGATREQVLDALAGTTAATAKACGGTNADYFHLFLGFFWGFTDRGKPETPKVNLSAEKRTSREVAP